MNGAESFLVALLLVTITFTLGAAFGFCAALLALSARRERKPGGYEGVTYKPPKGHSAMPVPPQGGSGTAPPIYPPKRP